VILYLDRAERLHSSLGQPGRGVGPRLLGIIEETGRETGLIRVWAWVLCVNERARRVFQKCGYTEIGVTERIHEGMSYKGFFLTKAIG
jgi:RimJ/RimL family protein N-acetyltransferase